jgi:hypothetical protein
MYEDSGGHEEIEQDRTSDERTDGSDVTGAGDESVDNVPASTSTYTPTATEEFSGEVVQLTGAQTTDIIWDKGNFGGFCYDMNGSVGTEMLTIESGTLTGPNVDRTIEVGALSYTTSPFYREYELHRNLGLTVTNSLSRWSSSIILISRPSQQARLGILAEVSHLLHSRSILRVRRSGSVCTKTGRNLTTR